VRFTHSVQQIAFEGVNAAAVGLVFTATFLLWQKALSIADAGSRRGPMPVGDSPLYVALVGIAFAGVGFMKVPAPLIIAAGGCVGLVHWLLLNVL
jgi:chromate transport protein ChrA